MRIYKTILSLFMICLLLPGSSWAGGTDTEFAQAKKQLAADKAALLKTLGVVAGTSGSVALLGYALNRSLAAPKSLIQQVARLPQPKGVRSRSSKHLINEKNYLKQEAEKLTRLAAMIQERRKILPKKGILSSNEVLPAKQVQKISKELKILDQVFIERYDKFDLRFNLYKADIKEFQRSGLIKRIETRAISTMEKEAAYIGGKQAVKGAVKAAPLVILLLWAATAQASPQEAAMASRLSQTPSLVLSLTPQEEKEIEKSQTLREIYIQIANHVHQLVQEPACQWEIWAEESAAQQTLQKELPKIRQEMLKVMAQ